MRKKYVQMSLLDIYHSVEERLETDKPELFRLLDEHLDWDELIPDTFYNAFYRRIGRNRKYELESFLRALFLQRIFGYLSDSLLLNTLRFSGEMRDYCGFDKVPDAAKLTRFKQDFCDHIRSVFERLVDLTEPICREMDGKLADLLLFDTTGIESYVAENNPKFPRNKAQNPTEYSGAAASNPAVKHQYLNGHFCFAQKAVVVANGLGIVRRLELLDEDFKRAHPGIEIDKRSNYPETDKEIGDSRTLKPILTDFRNAHPSLRYGTFSGDAAFDSGETFLFLLKEYGCSKAVIPFKRKPAADVDFNEHGTPLCPRDGTPFLFHSYTGGRNRSGRLKFVCPKSRSVRTERGSSRRCECESPCTDSKYGRVVYVLQDENLRLYPGLSRDSQEFSDIYARRTTVERTINALKDTLGVAGRKTSNVLTTKADLFLAGIVQLLCVLLADKLHDASLARRPRKLIA